MTLVRKGCIAAGAAVVLVLGSYRLPSQDQIPAAASPKPSVQDALLRTHRFAFGEEATLDDVVKHLRQSLGAPVVLDIAALKRLEITPEEMVQLELDGVRLKTGLKLLLDQVGLTYKVVPEDNLLILTDAQGTGEISERVLEELKAIHREIHDVQDAVEGLYGGQPEGNGPVIRKPTIIEEAPAEKAKSKDTDAPVSRSRAGL
jgi:hypothetical protein